MASKPLLVALGAAALLVATVVADASLSRTFAVDVATPEGHVTVAQWGDAARATDYGAPFGYTPIEANPNGTLTLRLRVDNGYPWAYEAPFEARSGATRLAQGTLSAPAEGTGEATFEIDAEPFFGNVPVEPGMKMNGQVYFTLDVGGRAMDVGFGVVEAKR